MTQLPAPPITPDMVAEARTKPGQWLYVVDPEFDARGEVPGWGVRGGYRVDERGQLAEFLPNPKFRPGPRTLNYPMPENRLERAIELLATGYGTDEAMFQALPDAQLILPEHPERPRQLHVLPQPDGSNLLHAFTSQRWLPGNWSHWQLATGRDLLNANLGRAAVRLNPDVRGAVSLTIPLS
ncbi:type VII secretion system-associated protein [Kutzneria sp. CA-103260]|uniref:type VII secretion system-associated protein n=1 Tax=Kutzneria sp. CA-103260 TaxID=2802641 RepID=UPI001BA93E1A|nr:type VII secretion system-associated protein [Kutzneria sp. CA-103260]QUQ70355.1 hypothetical protein JJ691_81310 [Kutzneria sp. CA-103260]